MDKLARKNKDKVIEVLTERLYFERTDVKLYDKILERVQESTEPAIRSMTSRLQEYREQEREHAKWLEDCIRQLGGDDKQITDRSRLAAQEAKGIEEVILEDSDVSHLLHALLAAEHVDSAGWDQLVGLADEAGDRTAKKEFGKRFEEEERHLSFLRDALQMLAAHEVLGEELKAPSPRTTHQDMPLA